MLKSRLSLFSPIHIFILSINKYFGANIYFQKIKNDWKNELTNRTFKFKLIITSITLVALLTFLTEFLLFIEQRPGALLNDPLLKLLPAIDVTWFTFFIIYLGLFVAVLHLIKYPKLFIAASQAYILMISLRIIAMYLIPLEPPAGMISLQDPVVEIFGTGQLLLKDLFFSGHTATLFLFSLTARTKKMRSFFIILTILVGAAVLIQHVHYSIDVFAAPFFAFASYKIVFSLNALK